MVEGCWALPAISVLCGLHFHHALTSPVDLSVTIVVVVKIEDAYSVAIEHPLSMQYRDLARTVESESFTFNAQAVDFEKNGDWGLAENCRKFVRDARRRAKDYRRFAELINVMFDFS